MSGFQIGIQIPCGHWKMLRIIGFTESIGVCLCVKCRKFQCLEASGESVYDASDYSKVRNLAESYKNRARLRSVKIYLAINSAWNA